MDKEQLEKLYNTVKKAVGFEVDFEDSKEFSLRQIDTLFQDRQIIYQNIRDSVTQFVKDEFSPSWFSNPFKGCSGDEEPMKILYDDCPFGDIILAAFRWEIPRLNDSGKMDFGLILNQEKKAAIPSSVHPLAVCPSTPKGLLDNVDMDSIKLGISTPSPL